ncbi:hypothetical protein I4U23_021934 [Adineta vaga]|nr:hypothetical protein I4U23_021934 [Adineta vaga]
MEDMSTHTHPKVGVALAKIFKFKLKNYERYRVYYTNNLTSDQKKKDFDRFGQLLDAYFIDKYAHRFDVAFSFPGDIRERVCSIAEKLCEKINGQNGRERIFYDKYRKAELARPNLDLYLHTIYRYQTRLIVVFMCDDYSRKELIKLCLSILSFDRIMLLSVDGKSIDGYMDISNEDDNNVVNAIYSRLKALGDPLTPSRSLHRPVQQSAIEKSMSRNIIRSVSPWYIILGLIAFILGYSLETTVLHFPVLVLIQHGIDDTVTPIETIRQWVTNRVKGDDVTFKNCPNHMHELHNDLK